jgi:hypothetical protein
MELRREGLRTRKSTWSPARVIVIIYFNPIYFEIKRLILQVVIFERPIRLGESNIENAFFDRIIYRRTIFSNNRQVSIPLAL